MALEMKGLIVKNALNRFHWIQAKQISAAMNVLFAAVAQQYLNIPALIAKES